jgi:hypothetical protein
MDTYLCCNPVIDSTTSVFPSALLQQEPERSLLETGDAKQADKDPSVEDGVLESPATRNTISTLAMFILTRLWLAVAGIC